MIGSWFAGTIEAPGQLQVDEAATRWLAEEGFDHADVVPPGVPEPDDCPQLSKVMADLSGRSADFWEHEWGALDVRYVGDTRPGGSALPGHHAMDGSEFPARQRVWLKARGDLPETPTLHRAVLAYASDLTLLGASTVPHGVMIGMNVQAASLDHAMWFNRPFRADRWLLYDQVSPSASGGLGLSTARLFQDGVLVSNVAQEGLIRPLREGS